MNKLHFYNRFTFVSLASWEIAVRFHPLQICAVNAEHLPMTWFTVVEICKRLRFPARNLVG